MNATREEVREAMGRAQRGRTVAIPPAGGSPVNAVVYAFNFADDSATASHVLTAGWNVSGSDPTNPNIGINPAGLEIEWSQGNVTMRAVVDLPVGGTVVEVPPCNACRVTAIIQPLPVAIPPVDVVATWTISGAPGHSTIARQPMVTSPYKTAGAAAVVEFTRQPFATGYRLLSPGIDMSLTNVPCVQANGTGTLQVDSGANRFYSATQPDKGMWGFYPLHPRATKIVVNNLGNAADYCAQWLLQLG